MNEIITELLNKLFSYLAIVSIVLSLLIIIAKFSLDKSSSAQRKFFEIISENSILLAWSIASLATLGSLFYSEVSKFIPCTYCWYERILMYPLVLILGIGVIKKDENAWMYGAPLSVTGIIVSIYHYQLQMFPDQNSFSCSGEVSCAGKWISEFGFVTMPFMAFSTFLLISVLLLVSRNKN